MSQGDHARPKKKEQTQAKEAKVKQAEYISLSLLPLLPSVQN
jgi:hypothetical protein